MTTANIKRGIAIILLSLVTAITINNAVFLHSHMMEDGIIVTHAHPFDKSADSLPFKNHKHTNFEYTITQGFGFFLLSPLLVLSFFTIVKKVQYYQYRERLYKIVRIKPSQRGPPFHAFA